MPHRVKFLLDGKAIPSANDITGLLRSEALERWLAVPGNKAKGKEAQRKGTAVAKLMEKLRKGKTVEGQTFGHMCAASLIRVQTRVVLEAECHLVNTLDRYHGSPDAIECEPTGEAVLVDDKVKKRFADYRLLMNEHLYAACDSIEKDGVITPVPWKWPIKRIVFNTFDPDTGKLYVEEHAFSSIVYSHAMTLRSAWDVAQASEAYFKEHAVLLPGQRGKVSNEPITQCTVAHPQGLVSDCAPSAI